MFLPFLEFQLKLFTPRNPISPLYFIYIYIYTVSGNDSMQLPSKVKPSIPISSFFTSKGQTSVNGNPEIDSIPPLTRQTNSIVEMPNFLRLFVWPRRQQKPNQDKQSHLHPFFECRRPSRKPEETWVSDETRNLVCWRQSFHTYPSRISC